MRYLKEEDKRDVNIEIHGLRNVLETIKERTKGLTNIKVMLYSEYFSVKEITDYINEKEWTKDFHYYLQDNNIVCEVVTVLPQQTVNFDKKLVKLK